MRRPLSTALAIAALFGLGANAPFRASPLQGCAEAADDADEREVEITNVLARADESMIRTRPALEAGKLARMALSPGDYFRGTLAVTRHDLREGTTTFGASRFALDAPLVPSLGDAHLENFGTLRASDGSIALEPNDFDGADRAPYLGDVRRLTAGVALAAAMSNEDEPGARQAVAEKRRAIARRAAEGYARAIDAARDGSPIGRIDSPGDSKVLKDLFDRSERDHATRDELTALTELEGTTRRLRRGVVDEEDPQNVLVDLPAFAAKELPETLERYRVTLRSAPPASFFTVLDAARELGSGVASWPRVRALVLVRGPSDDPNDDVVLEIKELTDSGIAGLYAPGLYWNSVNARIEGMTRIAWARIDTSPLWGTGTWAGLPVQIREESEGQKTLRIARFVGKRGTEEAIGAVAEVLGTLVGRIHTSGPDGLENAEAIGARIDGSRDEFLDEQADAGSAYADLVLADHARFVRSLRRRGPRLGVPFDAADAPRPDFASLLGTPPPPPDLPP